MDLRTLPKELSSLQRIAERRMRIEKELGHDLSTLTVKEAATAAAEGRNCEQMFGAVQVPVGYAGPLSVTFSSGESAALHLPLATTEGALVASVNRGCKVLSEAGGATLQSVHRGISRSIALKGEGLAQAIPKRENEWRSVGEATSEHLRILRYDIDEADDYTFLTVSADTDEAMGMNMITIAMQAIGTWIAEHCEATFVTVAGNVDADKKPSKRTHEKGRGYDVTAEVELPHSVIEEVLKTTPEAMADVAHAKLDAGSRIAGTIGANLHAANVIAALYLATGQDAAHVVEGSLADTSVEPRDDGLLVRTRVPAILCGIRGGGTALPAQKQCLDLLLSSNSSIHPCMQLAESIGAAVLAGEVSLLAAQASHQLSSAHRSLARPTSNLESET